MAGHYRYLVGIDEAGRGPLAGPVAVGLVALDLEAISEPKLYFAGIRDSKKLSPKQRESWFSRLASERQEARLSFATTLVGHQVIDREGINTAIRRGITESLAQVKLNPADCLILLDGGLRAPKEYFQQTLIRGDESEPVIALASIVAKVIRDRWLINLAKKYPGYGLEQHKGYGTKGHYQALAQLGPSPIHRRTFLHRPVKKA